MPSPQSCARSRTHYHAAPNAIGLLTAVCVHCAAPISRTHRRSPIWRTTETSTEVVMVVETPIIADCTVNATETVSDDRPPGYVTFGSFNTI